MAQPIAENEIEPPVTLPDYPRMPHRWQSVGLGLAGMVVLSFLALTLAVQFVRARPLDLRPATEGIGPTVVRVLQNQQIPSRYIEAAPLTLQRTPKAYFYRAQVEARVPEEINVDGLARVLERRLRRDGIYLADEVKSDDAIDLEFVLSDHAVAAIRLKPEFRYGSAEPARNATRAAPTPEPSTSPAASKTAAGPAAIAALQPQPSSSTQKRAWLPPKGPALKQAPETAATAMATQAPRIAIIVDDGGYGGAATDIILDLPPSLTLSVLPYTPFGESLAQEATQRGFEVLLHMPMENDSLRLNHTGQLDTVMTLADIRRLTHQALAQVPGAVGINNHTGSKFTANAEALDRFMRVVDDTGLFFVDSRTTPKSRAYDLALQFGIPAAERTLFLDHDNAPDAIRARFRELMHRAQAQGSAIGICHFRPNTALILREMLPQLDAKGIDLVPVSELVR